MFDWESIIIISHFFCSFFISALAFFFVSVMSHCKAATRLGKVIAVLADRVRCKDVSELTVPATHQLALSALHLLSYYNERGVICAHRQRRNVWIGVPRPGRSSLDLHNSADMLKIEPTADDILTIIEHLPHPAQVVSKYPAIYTHFVTRILSNMLRTSCPIIAAKMLAAQVNLTQDFRTLRPIDLILGFRMALLCTQTVVRKTTAIRAGDFDLDEDDDEDDAAGGDSSRSRSRSRRGGRATYSQSASAGSSGTQHRDYFNATSRRHSGRAYDWQSTVAPPPTHVEAGRKLLHQLAQRLLSQLRSHMQLFDACAAAALFAHPTTVSYPVEAPVVCTAFPPLLSIASTTRWFEQDVMLTETVLELSLHSVVDKVNRAELIMFIPMILSAIETRELTLSAADTALIERCVQHLYLIRHIRRLTAVRPPSTEELSTIITLALCSKEWWRGAGQRALTVVMRAYPDILERLGAVKRARVLRSILSIVYDSPMNLFAVDAMRYVVLPIFYRPQSDTWADEHAEGLTLRQHRRLINLLAGMLHLTTDDRMPLTRQEKAQMVELIYRYMQHVHASVHSSDERVARQATVQSRQLLTATVRCLTIRLSHREMENEACWREALPAHCVSVLQACQNTLRMLSDEGDGREGVRATRQTRGCRL